MNVHDEQQHNAQIESDDSDFLMYRILARPESINVKSKKQFRIIPKHLNNDQELDMSDDDEYEQNNDIDNNENETEPGKDIFHRFETEDEIGGGGEETEPAFFNHDSTSDGGEDIVDTEEDRQYEVDHNDNDSHSNKVAFFENMVSSPPQDYDEDHDQVSISSHHHDRENDNNNNNMEAMFRNVADDLQSLSGASDASKSQRSRRRKHHRRHHGHRRRRRHNDEDETLESEEYIAERQESSGVGFFEDPNENDGYVQEQYGGDEIDQGEGYYEDDFPDLPAHEFETEEEEGDEDEGMDHRPAPPPPQAPRHRQQEEKRQNPPRRANDQHNNYGGASYDHGYNDDQRREEERERTYESGHRQIRRSNDDPEVVLEKRGILCELDKLKLQGVMLTRQYTMQDSLDEMQYELDTHTKNIEMIGWVNQIKSMMGLSFYGLEVGNNMTGRWMKIDGWAQQMNSTLSQFDNALEKIYKRYLRRADKNPFMEILQIILMSLAACHFGNWISNVVSQNSGNNPLGAMLSGLMGGGGMGSMFGGGGNQQQQQQQQQGGFSMPQFPTYQQQQQQAFARQQQPQQQQPRPTPYPQAATNPPPPRNQTQTQTQNAAAPSGNSYGTPAPPPRSTDNTARRPLRRPRGGPPPTSSGDGQVGGNANQPMLGSLMSVLQGSQGRSIPTQ